MNTDDLADVTNDELLWAVECGEMELPEGFPEAIVARGEEFIETLCEIVIDPDNWRGLNDVHDGWSPIHAMHLLGGIGDPAATEALLEPLRDSDWDEYFLDDGPGIFAHLGPGAVPAMQRFARDEEGDDSAVNVVVDGLQGLGILHPECAEVARSVARDLVVWALDGEEEGWLSPLYVNQLAWLRNPEDLELLREAYEAGVWGDGMFTSWEYVESVYASAPLPDDLARLTLDPMDFYSERRMAEQRAFWNGVERREAGADGYEGQRFTRVPPPTGPGPAVPKPSMWLESPAARVVPPGGTRKPKIGRNAPCPCGSGKKYKRCCGR